MTRVALSFFGLVVVSSAVVCGRAMADEVPSATSAAWNLRLTAGAGFGARELELPRDGVVSLTQTGLFPVADLGFELGHRLSGGFSLELVASYQASLGLRIVEQLTDGSEHPRDTRLHQLDLALAPTLAFDARHLWSLRLALGYAWSDFRPVAHLVTPAYFLAGPSVRLELQAPLWAERLRLRLGPEVRWLTHVGRELMHHGAASSGYGASAFVELELLLGRFAVALHYRELRSWLGSQEARSIVEATRFVVARLEGTL